MKEKNKYCIKTKCAYCNKIIWRSKYHKPKFYCCDNLCQHFYRILKDYQNYKKMIELNKEKFIWLLGFLEGDGCITKNKKNKSYYIWIGQANEKFIKNIKKIFNIKSKITSNKGLGIIMYGINIVRQGEILALTEFGKNIVISKKWQKRVNSAYNYLSKKYLTKRKNNK